MANFRCRVQGSGSAGDIWINTVYVSSGQSLSAVGTAWEAFCNSFFGDTMAGLWCAAQGASDWTVDQLAEGSHKNTAQATGSLDIQGTSTGDCLPPTSAVVCGLRTATPTRAGRGRIYVLAPTADNLDSTGLLTSANQTAIATALASDLGTLSSTGTVVIFHVLDASITPVTEVTVGRVLGDQRRRTNKVAADYVTKSLS